MQGSKTVSESLSSQWRLCCSAGVKNKWRLKHNLRCETHFLSRVCVCVMVRGEEGKRNVIEVTMAIQFQNTPPSTLIHKHTLPSASLTPIPSLEQKSKYFWEEFPRSWRLRRVSPTDLSEVWVNVFPAGDPCSHMHPHRSAEHGSYTKQC